MFKTVLILVWAFGFAIFASFPATAESFDYHFDVRLGVAKIGKMQVAANNDGNSYSAAATLQTTGLIGAIYDVRYEQRASGLVGPNGALLPLRYTSINEVRGSVSGLEILFIGNRVASVSYDPERIVAPEVITFRNTVDPMSLMYFLLRPVRIEDVCTGTVDLFGGRDQSTVRFSYILRYNDGRVKCDIQYLSEDGEAGIAVSALVFRPDNNGFMRIQSFNAHTGIGTLSVRAS